jgi:hypothetical protein
MKKKRRTLLTRIYRALRYHFLRKKYYNDEYP